MKYLISPVLLLMLSACQSTGGGGPGASQVAVELPADYRARAAVYLASDYSKDAIGAPEISATPRSGTGLFGSASSVRVRYPVRTHSLGQQMIARGWLLDRMEKTETGMRCITISVERNIGTGGETRFKAYRAQVDGDGCDDKQDFVPYTELAAMGDRLRACKEKGEERCLLSTNMPEAEARKLMNQR